MTEPITVRRVDVDVSPMTGAELREARKDLHLDAKRLAELTGHNNTTIWRYEAGRDPVPRHMAVIVRLLLRRVSDVG